MYEDLVKSLKICGTPALINEKCIAFHDGCCEAEPVCMYELMRKAADAIDKLVKICNSILSKYEEAAEDVIYEYSGHIGEDIDELHKEIEDYKAQINGVAEPPKEGE